MARNSHLRVHGALMGLYRHTTREALIVAEVDRQKTPTPIMPQTDYWQNEPLNDEDLKFAKFSYCMRWVRKCLVMIVFPIGILMGLYLMLFNSGWWLGMTWFCIEFVQDSWPTMFHQCYIWAEPFDQFWRIDM